MTLIVNYFNFINKITNIVIVEKIMAREGIEPAISALLARRSNQLS